MWQDWNSVFSFLLDIFFDFYKGLQFKRRPKSKHTFCKSLAQTSFCMAVIQMSIHQCLLPAILLHRKILLTFWSKYEKKVWLIMTADGEKCSLTKITRPYLLVWCPQQRLLSFSFISLCYGTSLRPPLAMNLLISKLIDMSIYSAGIYKKQEMPEVSLRH